MERGTCGHQCTFDCAGGGYYSGQCKDTCGAEPVSYIVTLMKEQAFSYWYYFQVISDIIRGEKVTVRPWLNRNEKREQGGRAI